MFCESIVKKRHVYGLIHQFLTAVIFPNLILIPVIQIYKTPVNNDLGGEVPPVGFPLITQKR